MHLRLKVPGFGFEGSLMESVVSGVGLEGDAKSRFNEILQVPRKFLLVWVYRLGSYLCSHSKCSGRVYIYLWSSSRISLIRMPFN